MQILCARCQKPLHVPYSAAGQSVRCPLCQAIFVAPVLPDVDPNLPTAEPVSSETRITTPPPLPIVEESPGDRDETAKPHAWDREDRQIGLRQVRQGTLLSMGAGLLSGAGLYFLFYIVIHFLLSGCMLPGFPMRGPGRPLIALLFAATILFCVPSIFMFIGAANLRTARSRGLVVTGVVFDFIMCAVLALGIIYRVLTLENVPAMEVTVGLTFIHILLAAGGIALGLVAGIRVLFLLHRPGIKEAFGYSRREALDEGDTEWEHQRRLRRRHGGED